MLFAAILLSIQRNLVCCFLFISLLLSTTTHAWDRHNLLTTFAINGFSQKSDAALIDELNDSIEVTSMQEFMRTAFGPQCTWPKMRDQVMNGLGKDYAIHYVEKVRYKYAVDWDKGISRIGLILSPEDPAENSQAIGKSVLARSVLSIYSDEPDWLMDDDVPRLKGKGIYPSVEGAGTRLLRHFWYKNETHFGIHFDKDQETDDRMQLFFELSQIAFHSNQPYWGYRFLAISLHYLQDITQPFHTQSIINTNMIHKTDVVTAQMCEWRKSIRKRMKDNPPICHGPTLDEAIVQNGWILGSYHALYEDYLLGLLDSDRFESIQHLITGEDLSNRITFENQKNGILNARKILHTAQRAILPFTPLVGEFALKTFGNNYRDKPEWTINQILMTGTQRSFGWRIAATPDLDNYLDLDQLQARPQLSQNTHAILKRIGSWTRTYLANSLRVKNTPSAIQENSIKKLQKKLKALCE